MLPTPGPRRRGIWPSRSMSQVHRGSCHCGAVSVAFGATRALEDLPLGRCDCSFCRRHGARTMADPAGHLTILAPEGGLRRYRFGLGITDFLLCATCGVYVAPVIAHEGQHYASLNVNMLYVRDVLDAPRHPADEFRAELRAFCNRAGERARRRCERARLCT